MYSDDETTKLAASFMVLSNPYTFRYMTRYRFWTDDELSVL